MALVWNESYSVHVTQIDLQHQHFLGILNSLYDAIYASNTKEVIEGVFVELEKYSQYHFKTEETYFEQFQYEDAEIHIKKHQEFREKISALRTKYTDNSLALSVDLVDYLENWLIEHVATMDQKYVTCFQSHGLT
jgi:hemerythrin